MGGMKLESVPSTKQKVYQNMFEHMGLGNHTVVANLIVTKIGKNLKFWPDESEIVAKTLELLTDMAGGYSSSKLLLTLDTVKYLARHHTEDEFPFLTVAAERHRTTFHAILTRLLLSPSGEEKLGLTFDQFMEPIVNSMNQLGALDSSQLRSPAARIPIIGVFRDLRGIAQSLHNRRTFGMLFDLLEPRHMPLFSKVADLWYDQPDVMISLLRFMHEFCHNKANRVNFDQSSPNGILLFRATSDVVCAFGRKILSSGAPPNGGDIYKMKYKGMSIALSVLNSALGGNYVCFGVFALYNDPALDNALDVSLQMALSIPLDHVIAYPKLSKSVFGFIEIMFRNHNKTTMALDTNVFMQLMNAVHEGLQSSDAAISSMCANSIDHLATFYYENSGKDKPEVHSLNNVSQLNFHYVDPAPFTPT